jgi:hypothetical protein
MGAISTSEEGTTSLSKMEDSPRFPAVWVRRILLPPPGAGEAEASPLPPRGPVRLPDDDARRCCCCCCF